jgi:hypothetical protein
MLAKHHLLIFLSIVVALLVGVLGWSAWSDSRSTSRQSSPASALQLPVAVAAVARRLSALPVRPLSPKTETLRARAAGIAAKGRALAWLSEPGMTELTGWEYGLRTKEMAEVFGGEDLQNLGRLAAAGGVLPESLDLPTLAASFTALSAGATYSPFDKQILLLSNSKPGESLLTHELTHALQDQHFDLQRMLLARPYSYDRSEAAFAVIEGDAVGVQRRAENPAWTKRTLDDIARIEDSRFDEYRSTIGNLFPSLLTETFIFRYRDGTRFVEGVRRRRAQAGVDDLFRNPPQTSEQVLHLDKYLAGEAARVPAFDSSSLSRDGWQAGISTAFGEIGVRGILAERLSSSDARRAAAGWGGDQAYLFEREGESLFVWTTVWDTSEDAAEFFRGYNRLLAGRNLKSDGEKPDAKIVWLEADGRETIVRRAGDSVLIVRGKSETAKVLEQLGG